jgi:hypothetical protein
LDFDLAAAVDALGAVLAVVFAAALAVGLAVDFFFVVDVCGKGPPAHAPMAKAANKATENGTARFKNPVYTVRAVERGPTGETACPTSLHLRDVVGQAVADWRFVAHALMRAASRLVSMPVLG